MRITGAFTALLLFTTPVMALEGATGPVLGASSNFGQNWQPEALDGGAEIGITEFRDEVIWNHVEQANGELKFGSMREAYPSMLSNRGFGLVLLGYTGHPNWEDGRTPRTPEGQAAFARYHARIVERFPFIHSVEVGNEYNSVGFPEEEGWPESLEERARLYVRLLEVTRRAVLDVNPDVRILGGAAHSIPLAWIEAVVAEGGHKHMDAFVLHPYTTEPEQFARQVAEMRRLPELATMPIEITEFGTTDAAAAPGYLLRMYCQMALSGVSRAVWYPFTPRGDGLIALIEETGEATETGLAYAHIRDRMEGRPVEDVAPDAFTYACQFGPNTLVIWGAPREVELGEGIRAASATGSPINGQLELSRTEPLVLISDTGPVRLGETVHLGPQRMRADTYDQFAYPYPYRSEGEGLSVVVRRDAQDQPLEVRPGQERGGVPWTPYLGIPEDGEVRVGADWASPSAWGADRPLSIVYRYRSPVAERVELSVNIAPDASSTDGLDLEVTLNGRSLRRIKVQDDELLTLPSLDLSAEDLLEIVVGPNVEPDLDHARLRIQVEANQ
ncbi:hypothetical protein [Histidinibacterium aquaticum]|uniref:Asl1-like glycosyl hydrolase catalytic domain-containing protein n=1 Tax=Histidinibacterium aquaticum TaxID=2613962 RepID=A0A5J5GM44_9RHOB|nr:hypothetical protein [Histidinibacterium aquaticum]KAA9009426.1 hypothetical protein F3S47_09295 [Histidinibacterium aquaticum]